MGSFPGTIATTEPTVPSPVDTHTCYGARPHSSVLQGSPMGGIPTVFLANLVVAVILVLVFSYLRKAAWNYGRLALVSERDSLASLFYSETDREGSMSEASFYEEEGHYKGIFSWIRGSFRVSQEDFHARCGVDAVYYLSFQRYAIGLLCIITVLSMGVILPINISGDMMGGDIYNFGRTTIVNISPSNNILWVHTTFTVLYFFITVVLMQRHRRLVDHKHENMEMRTLFITGLPKEITNSAIVAAHFHEAYPGCTVTGVQFCYDVQRLMKLDTKKRRAMQGRLYCLAMSKKERAPVMVRVRAQGCLRLCDVCGICRKVDGVQYHSEREEALTDECENEKMRVLTKPLGMAFATFQDACMTQAILREYGLCRCLRRPTRSRVSDSLRSSRWHVSYAPAPQTICWDNLSVQGWVWWLRFFLINVPLFVLIFFLTTPSIIISSMDKWNVTRTVEDLNNPLISQFFPSILLWIFSATLPFIVYQSTTYEAHWTKSATNQFLMHKTYTFLVFMVLILPSLGLSSFDVFFRWLFDKDLLKSGTIRFECVFLPDNGAFFVNYVVTAALLGSAARLLRLPELALYGLRLCLARSDAHRHHVRKRCCYEFPYGLEYAWTMCIITVTMSYSVTCPIITPFGLLYMVLKHYVDRYNLFFTYLPAKMEKKTHKAAVTQLLMAPLLCILWLLFFSILRLGLRRPITMFLTEVLGFAGATVLLWLLYKALKRLLRSRQPTVVEPPVGVEDDAEDGSSRSSAAVPLFVAEVLREPTLDLSLADSPSRHSYGSLAPNSPSEAQPSPEGAPTTPSPASTPASTPRPADPHPDPHDAPHHVQPPKELRDFCARGDAGDGYDGD
ncbi:osmosensitive cation channel TMEM63C-like isoform X2 [Petromyzon marinus]|uniref:CSC1-like protein 2 isoform X2 n=1 Tax=Petromyzon marinus TaxID=7757 RepID=A0AAJ7TPL8_PETMA|nr:CSC1-like protein 2 isoform X2 [Petromyzon marinus]